MATQVENLPFVLVLLCQTQALQNILLIPVALIDVYQSLLGVLMMGALQKD